MRGKNGARPAGAVTPNGAPKDALGTRPPSKPTPNPDQAAALTDEESALLEGYAKRIEKLEATAILKIAECLAKAHELFRYRRDEGGFGGWVESRLKFTRQTAYNLLHVHKQFGGEHLSNAVDRFPATVLYRLAAPSTPPEVRDEIIERAKTGEKVTLREVENAIKPKPAAGEMISSPEVEAAQRALDDHEGDDAVVRFQALATMPEQRAPRRSSEEMREKRFRTGPMAFLAGIASISEALEAQAFDAVERKELLFGIGKAIVVLEALRERIKKAGAP